MKRMAVLMTCFNRREKTLRCLRDLSAQNPIAEVAPEVFLVDDASTDGTGAAVRAAFPHVHLIEGTGDLFWCRGMRRAWDAAAAVCDYDYYLWLNDDTTIDKDCLERLMELSNRHPGAIISGKVADPLSGKIVYGGNPQSLNGNVLLVPREAYRTLGPIDGHYHQRYGDRDYGLRAQRRGVPIVVTPNAVGTCLFNPGPVGQTKEWTLRRRVQSLFRPTEFHLGDAFRYGCKRHGVLWGFASVSHVVMKVMFGRA